MVGVTGFEPATSWSQTRRSTKLSYTPQFPRALRFRKGGHLVGRHYGVIPAARKQLCQKNSSTPLWRPGRHPPERPAHFFFFFFFFFFDFFDFFWSLSFFELELRLLEYLTGGAT